jgi:signal transduction histidine kinase
MVWVAPRGMPLQIYNPVTRHFTSLAGLPGEPIAKGAANILTLYEDSKRYLWIGTQGSGLFKYDRYAKRFTGYGYNPMDSTSLSYDVVTAIHEDRKGTLWVGTSEGLNKFNREKGTFIQYTEREGLPGASIYGILEDNNGYLWISTDHGIVRFDDRLPPGQKFRSFELSDGLQGYEFNKGAYYEASDGEMFFGGTNGINSFYPERMNDNPFIPPVVITSFKKFNKEAALERAIDEADTVEIMYRDNTISFEFAALEFSNPLRNKYAYWLEGFDKDWTYSNNVHGVTYTNLDPGTYTLRVKASNNDDAWNERGISLALVVLPPFWMTWWYRLIMAGVIIIAIAMYFRRREERHREARLAQEEFSRRLIDSQEGERKRIASGLHDSLGQNIMVMKNKALLALQEMEAGSFMAKQVEDISSIASQTLDEARRIAYNLRPYQLDRFGLTEAIRYMLEETSRTSSIDCDCTVDEIEGLFPKDSEINIYRIVQESVNNIMKHSGATQARVKVRRVDSEVMLEIRDNGKGLDSVDGMEVSHERSGLGLLGIRERVKLLAGTFSIHSVPARGTKIIISIPIKHFIK